MRDQSLKHEADVLLKALGASRTEVAVALRQVGIRALLDPQGCAVAVYLGALLGADMRVKSLRVGRAAVTLFTSERRRWIHRPHLGGVRLPDPVRQSIFAFDEALYPDLLREDWRHGPVTPARAKNQLTRAEVSTPK